MPKNSYAAVNSRREELLRFLALNQNSPLSDITAEFGTSEMTIRRDLLALSEEGLIMKGVNGRYSLNCDPAFDPKYFLRYSANHGKKLAIAQRAVSLISPGNFIFLDSGTTVLELAKQLVDVPSISILTNNLYIPQYISQRPSSIEIEFLGGNVNLPSMSTTGVSACQKIEQYNADFVFFSADGLDAVRGVTTKEYQLIDVKKAMLQHASAKVLLIDSTKINVSAVQIVAAVEDIDIIVTDDQISDASYLQFSQLAREIIVAKT